MSPLSQRVEALRARLLVNWSELAAMLDISRSMLNYVRSGAREPGPKLLRRIAELESRAAPAGQASAPTNRQQVGDRNIVAEAPPYYGGSDLEAVVEMLSDAQAKTAAALQIVIGRIRDEKQRGRDGT